MGQFSTKKFNDNIPLDNRLLKQWLKSGFIKDDTLFPTDSGTPQGGIISPILANMVLDGIEEVVKRHKARFQKMKDGVILYRHTNRLNFIRYADDCVPRKLGTSSNGGELVSYAA